jgi:hypothetical protein
VLLKQTFVFLPLGCLLFAVSAQATVIYSDTTTFTGSGFADGGATVIAGNDITKMIADDITVAPGFAGATVSSFTFSVANFNTSAVTAKPLVRFYSNDGTSGGPGTLLGAIGFTPISFSAGTVGLFTFTGSNLFTVPTSGTFWAGITFDDNTGTTGATAAQLNNLGQGLFNPPTVGSSQDSFFVTTSAGDFSASNPAGVFDFFGGNPVANFGWSFSGAAATPEPGTGMLSFLAAIPLAAGFIRQRRRRSK